MDRQYGWGLNGFFGRFICAAGSILASASVAFATAFFLAAYHHPEAITQRQPQEKKTAARIRSLMRT